MSAQYSIRTVRLDANKEWRFVEVAVIRGTLKQAEAAALARNKNSAHYVCLLTEKSTAWAGATEVDRT